MSINTSDTTSQPVFEDRLRAVWSSIQKSECFANSSPKDVLISLVGDYTLESPDNQKSVAVNMYHFGTVLDNVMLVFSPTDQKLTIVVDVSRERSFNCLKSLVQSGEEGQNISSLNVHIVEFESKRDLERVFAITENSGPMKIFTAMKELPLQKGRLADAMNEFLKEHSQSLSVNDGTSALSEALVIKDSKALDCVRKASSFASYIMKHVALETIEESLTEEDVEISASALSTKLQTSILTPTTVEGLENVKQYSYGISLAPPLVLSGPVENPNPLRRPIPDLISNSPLRDDVICVAFGVKYAGYVSYLARTFLFNCESTEQSNYDALMDLFDDLLQELKPGVRIGVVCETVRVNFERKYPELIPHLTPTMGFGVGLEVLEKTCNLTTKNDRILQPGMTLAVRVAFEGLTKNKGLSPYHMLIADTVVITDDGNTEPLSKIPYEKRYVAKKISMNEDLEKSSSRPLAIHERSSRSAKGIQLQAEDERNKIQAQIREQRRKEAEKSDKKSVKGPETEQDQSELARLARGAIKTYENERDLPTVRPGSMVVDRGHSALLLTGLLPNGAISVFHIATIRLVEAKTEGESILFRIHFHHLQETNIAHRIHQDKIFLKELSFRVKSQSFADSVVKEIKGVQAMIKQRDAQRKQQSEVIQQKGLILSKENTRRLRDVRCYPNPRQTVGGRGAPVGDLEAHENGIRFLLRDQQPLQVLYNNIQCILFQPADSEGRVLIHFHLKQHIQVGKKKTLDVQFYLDVTEESEAVGAKRFRTEAEEEMEEEREKERITKVNTEFLHYAKKLENVTLMKVEVPLKSFTFNGTHDKAMVRFRASDRTLFSVTEPPPFVQNMEQVEIVVFERVTSLKTDFDLTFVLKDYTTKHLTTVQYKMIDRIKDWFNAASVKYYELDVNLQWRTVLKEIKADEEWDPWGPNGWESILGESEENDESDENSSASDSDESDSEFVLSSEEDSDSDSSDEELDSDFVDESSGSAGSNSDDEEALDWDELERRAEAEDRKRGLDSGSDDDKRKKSSGHKHKKRSHSSSESESSSASSDSTPKKNKNKKKKQKK